MTANTRRTGIAVSGLGWVLLVFLGGCQSFSNATIDFDQAADFTIYETFSWVSEHPLRLHTMESHLSPLLERRLMDATRDQLASRGLRFVDDVSQADLGVGFSVGSREQILVNGYPINSAAISGDEFESSYWSNSSRAMGQFVEGQICVDLFDMTARRPIWHGTVKESIPQSDFDFWQRNVQTTIAAIVAGYPPGTDPR